MSLLRGRINPSLVEHRYESLGFLRNPFPSQGEVFPKVYVSRPELQGLESDLVRFLSGDQRGKVWALSGEQGVGKSNFLQTVNAELDSTRASGELAETAFHLFGGNAWLPVHLVSGIAHAIGSDSTLKLLERDPSVPREYEETDFGRFWSAAVQHSSPVDRTNAAAFLIRWIGGGQTYADERKRYGIQARDRLAPALGVPYLRALMSMLAREGILKRIVLLFDELENVQALQKGAQEQYIQLLKTLINAFNWEGLYVILGGAPSVFDHIRQTLPSLASRWELVQLQALKAPAEAVALAQAYKEHAATGDSDLSKSFPNSERVEKAYLELAVHAGGRVRQRQLLTSLHALVEDRVNAAAPSPKAPAGKSTAATLSQQLRDTKK